MTDYGEGTEVLGTEGDAGTLGCYADNAPFTPYSLWGVSPLLLRTQEFNPQSPLLSETLQESLGSPNLPTQPHNLPASCTPWSLLEPARNVQNLLKQALHVLLHHPALEVQGPERVGPDPSQPTPHQASYPWTPIPVLGPVLGRL